MCMGTSLRSNSRTTKPPPFRAGVGSNAAGGDDDEVGALGAEPHLNEAFHDFWAAHPVVHHGCCPSNDFGGDGHICLSPS